MTNIETTEKKSAQATKTKKIICQSSASILCKCPSRDARA